MITKLLELGIGEVFEAYMTDGHVISCGIVLLPTGEKQRTEVDVSAKLTDLDHGMDEIGAALKNPPKSVRVLTLFAGGSQLIAIGAFDGASRLLSILEVRPSNPRSFYDISLAEAADFPDRNSLELYQPADWEGSTFRIDIRDPRTLFSLIASK